jgi:hypothetical protein
MNFPKLIEKSMYQLQTIWRCDTGPNVGHGQETNANPGLIVGPSNYMGAWQ